MPPIGLSWSISSPDGISAHAQPDGGHVGVVGIGFEMGGPRGTGIGRAGAERVVLRGRREEGRRWRMMREMRVGSWCVARKGEVMVVWLEGLGDFGVWTG